MGQIVVNVGSFDLTSHNGNTAYSTTRYFDIPANAGITGCVATFAQHVNTGSFQGKSFSLNGAQAHPNTPWPTSGISLNPALLSTGQNSFRAAVKSQAGLSARWAIGDIYLTIDYNDVGGGGGTTDPGSISISASSLTAGESLTVSITGASSGVYRDVYIQKMPSTANILSVVQGHGSGTGSWTVAIPEPWCETLSPNDPSFEVRIYMASYIAGGTDVGNGARMLTVNVPASAVPTIGAFTATRDANGVDASITKYVQNYSKVNLLMGNVAGALGSGIASYEITGGGFSAVAASAAFGPFAQTGDITFTAKVTDTRGRTATRTVTINVLSYGPAAFSNPEAWRSSDAGVKNQKGTYARLKSGVSYSSLDGQNSVTLKGRVYPKGGTVPAYTSMTPGTAWITGGGLLLVTKTYIAQMEVADLIGSRTIEFTIPTKKTGISIMAGMQGIAFGKSVEIPGVSESAWPIVAPGLAPNPNLLHNWDFRNQVNQRGLTDGQFISSVSPAYGIDRWLFAGATRYTDHLSITPRFGCFIDQKLEMPVSEISGKTVTASLLTNLGYISARGVFPASGDLYLSLTPDHSYKVELKSGIGGFPGIRIHTTDANNAIYAAKLELGTTSTLHLDPPMDHAVELLKCQRYFFRLTNWTCGAGIVAGGAARFYHALVYPVKMRITPTMTFTGATMGEVGNCVITAAIGNDGCIYEFITDKTTYGSYLRITTIDGSADL